MKLIIAGGRSVPYQRALSLIDEAFTTLSRKDSVTEIVQGGAKGIDAAAKDYFSGIYPVTEYPADWDKHGGAAGPIRNRQMAEYADALLAIWDGKSRGTKNMIGIASKRGLIVHVYQYEA